MGPLLKDSFGIGNAELTMINTATVLGGLAGRLIGGYIADRWGRRAALSLNLLVYTLGGLISAAAVNYEMLLASRFIVGVGLGGEFTVGLAILAEIVATRHRGTLLATLNISSGGIGNIASFGFFWLVLGPLNGVARRQRQLVALDVRDPRRPGAAGRVLPPLPARVAALPALEGPHRGRQQAPRDPRLRTALRSPAPRQASPLTEARHPPRR